MLVFENKNESFDYKLSSCCNPIPGDDVFGFVSKSEGIKVHSMECPNSIALNSQYAYRIIKASWVDSASEEFKTSLKISGIDNKGLVNEITKLTLGFSGVNLNKIEFSAEGEFFKCQIDLSLNVKKP